MPLRSQPPPGPPAQLDQGDRLVSTLVYFNSKSTNRQIDDIESKQTISWSINNSLPKSQSIAGCWVVDASGSRAQLSVLEPLVSKVTLSLSLLPALAKESKRTQNNRLMLLFSLTFRGEKTLDPGDCTQIKRTKITTQDNLQVMCKTFGSCQQDNLPAKSDTR